MSVYTWAVDGQHWHEKPRPCWFHRCKASTLGTDHGVLVGRCACGAIRIASGSWSERNSRKADA